MEKEERNRRAVNTQEAGENYDFTIRPFSTRLRELSS